MRWAPEICFVSGEDGYVLGNVFDYWLEGLIEVVDISLLTFCCVEQRDGAANAR